MTKSLWSTFSQISSFENRFREEKWMVMPYFKHGQNVIILNSGLLFSIIQAFRLPEGNHNQKSSPAGLSTSRNIDYKGLSHFEAVLFFIVFA